MKERIPSKRHNHAPLLSFPQVLHHQVKLGAIWIDLKDVPKSFPFTHAIPTSLLPAEHTRLGCGSC